MRAPRRDGTGSSGVASVTWSIGGIDPDGRRSTWGIGCLDERCCAAGRGWRRVPPSSADRSGASSPWPTAHRRQAPNLRDLRAIPDLRDGQVRLWLPEGFQYRSFHDTEFPTVLNDGTALPGRHDGMGAFPGPNGNVMLVRNHEINNPGAPFGRRLARRTTRWPQRHDHRRGDARRAGRQGLHQPQRHADELLRRRDAVGQLDHVRGDGQRA